MSSDFLDAVFLVTKPLCGVLSAEPLDDADGGLCDVTGKVDLVDATEDDIVNLHWVTGRERGPANKWRDATLKMA